MEDEKTNVFNKVVFVLDQNIRAVQFGAYTVAFTGLAIALRTVRPFSKFKNPSDVPKHFFESRTKLKGTVERIEANGALLMVNHRPVIRLSRKSNPEDHIPIKITGVNIGSNGISWLQTIVAGREISFIPVMKNEKNLSCEVFLYRAPKDLKKKVQTLNIGPALVQVGFATIAPIEKHLSSNEHHLAYYRQLITAEQTLKRKQLGLWYYAEPTKRLTSAIVGKMVSFVLQKRQMQLKPVTTTST